MTFLTSKTTAAIAVSLALAACGTQQTTTTGSAVGVERKQTFSISSEAINSQAAQSYAEMVTQARTKGVLNNDAAMTARVRGIANRLIAKAPVLRPDSKSWAWEVNVFTDKEINAFCFAHALREHTREQQSREQGIGFVSGVIGAVGEAYGLSNVGQIASIGADLGFNLPFSRAHETEADQLGIELAARAGYNPDAAVTLWDKMQRVEGGEVPQILSTHPNSGNRLASLRVLAEKVRPLYLAAKKK